MPPGKMAAQAGHAFLEAFLASGAEEASAYRDGTVGTKVVLEGSHLQILKAQRECERLGVPHALIEDSGHVFPPHFDGSPVVTALGVGLSPQAETITKKFNLLRSTP